MRKLIRIIILEIKGDNLYVAGNIRNYDAANEKIWVSDETNHNIYLNPVRTPQIDTYSRDKSKINKGFSFELRLPLVNGAAYSFKCTRGQDTVVLEPRYGRFSGLPGTGNAVYSNGTHIIRADGNLIRVSSANALSSIIYKRKFRHSLIKEAPEEVIKLRRKARELQKKNRPIWLISDRTDCAGDNGMAFFEYLMKSPECAAIRERCDIRFVIGSDCPDFEIMRSIGPVVEAASEMHKALFIASELIISSSGDEWFRNPLGSDLKYCRDLVKTRFVFLQHGVIMNDLSTWLHKFNKNISLFITTSPGEAESIKEYGYGYDDKIVRLTGLARYDKLCNEQEKTIAFLPTWRKYAAPLLIPGSSERPYSEDFRNSEYFAFYNRLINDPVLIEVMKKHGYSGTFYLHPNHMNQWRDFHGNSTISVWHEEVPFSKVFSKSSLLVTDYSSVSVDFAYLGKPVLYAQFDRERFFMDHTVKNGYFDYEADGFGPVCRDYDSTLKGICEIIENNCIEPEIYQERADRFFAFRDRNNCHRILDEIMKL